MSWCTSSIRRGLRPCCTTLLLTGAFAIGGGAASRVAAQEPAADRTARLAFHSAAGDLIVEVSDELPIGEVRTLRFSDPRSRRLEGALRQRLDRNRDGRVDEAEWQSRWSALMTADFDQDEVLVPLEVSPSLLSEAADVAAKEAGRVFDLRTPEGADASRSQAGEKAPAADGTPDLRVAIVREPTLHVSVTALRPDIHVRELDQGRRIEIARDHLRLDLWPTFPTSTKPSGTDGRTTVASIQARPGRRGAFEWFDQDGDGRLTRREVTSAELPRELSQAFGDEAETASFTLQIGPADSLRRTSVPLATDAPRSSEAQGPAWFAAMDRNRDGEVSPDEFLGGDTRFRSADLDQDGRLSPGEARQLSSSDSR